MSAKIPPKPSKDVIYIDVDDEITSIIDKVENSEHKVVALVLPKRATSLQSIVNMKLLARSAETAGKNPVLITSEGALLPLAGAAGLHVAKNLQSKPEIPESPIAQSQKPAEDLPAEEVPDADVDEDLPSKIDYANAASIGALAAAHEAEHPETIDLDDEDAADEPDAKAAKTPKDKKNKVPDFDRFRMLLGLGVLGLIGLIVFIYLAIAVLPKAVITITTTSEPVSATFTMTASAGTVTLDTKAGAIPAKLETTDQTGSQQATATGQQNNGQTATGAVTMRTQDCSGLLPSSIPSGTGITSGGVSYITQAKANFSPTTDSGGHCYYTSGSTAITAQQAGAKYNANISGAAVASGITASGSASGGTDSIVTILSQGDVDTAAQKVTTGTTSADFTKTWEAKLSAQGEYVLASTLKASDPVVSSSPSAGQPASTATVTVKTTYTVLTIKKTDLSQALNDKLAGQIDKTKQKLSPSSLNDATVTVQAQSAPNQATLSISVDTTAVPIINVATVKKVAEGKKTGDVTAVINNWAGVKVVTVKLSPFWVSKVPNNPAKITVVIKEVKASSNTSGQP